MGNTLVPKIFLEGTCLTFKTDIAFGLNEQPSSIAAMTNSDTPSVSGYDHSKSWYQAMDW